MFRTVDLSNFIDLFSCQPELTRLTFIDSSQLSSWQTKIMHEIFSSLHKKD